MPPIEKHCEISRIRTGSDYRELHEWMDADPAKKVERHSVARICEYGQLMTAKYGKEGFEEYVQHIYDDFLTRFENRQADLEPAIASQVAAADLRSQLSGGPGKECSIPVSDVDMMRREGMSETDIAHCIHVAHNSLDLAERIGAKLDMELVARGGLLHDLGKARSRGDDHGIVGAQIGRELGLPEQITAIMEQHVRAGLTAEEAQTLGLPPKDYSADSLEAKIVIYADKLVDIITAQERLVTTEPEAEARFEEILRSHARLAKGEKAIERLLRYRSEIRDLIRQRTTGKRGE